MHCVLFVFAILVAAFAGSSPAPRSKEDPIDYRLPQSIEPEAYIICLVPYLENEGDKSFTFEGSVNIRVTAKQATDVITLHSSGLTILESKTEVTDVSRNTKLAVLEHTPDALREFLHIKVDSQLEVGGFYEIHMQYNGTLRDDMSGFYKSSYDQGGDIKWMATTQFQSTDARKAFPCFDEPAMKATFILNIAYRTNMHHVLSNMPALEYSPPDLAVDGRVWVTFKETPPMSTYLLAFIISDFTELGTDEFKVWARRDSIAQAAYCVTVGPQLLSKLEEFTGIEYVLPKLDNIAIADFAAGAMENWGLMTYREASLLYDPAESTELNKQRVATVVAHEATHLWFGDLVTLDWWGYTWLNEGFARYMQVVITDMVETEWDIVDQFVVDHLQLIFKSDALVASPALSNPECQSPADINAMFGTTSYSKGGSVLRMMDHFLTRPVFQDGLHNYLQNNSYANTIPSQLFAELDATASAAGVLPDGVTVAAVMDGWTLKSGYPYITVARSPADGNKLVITQKRFLLQADETNPDTTLWWIPLSMTRENDTFGGKAFQDTTAQHWIKGVQTYEMTNDIGVDEWVIFNNQQTGYYRVAYLGQLWQPILRALQASDFEKIHAINRAQLIDDTLNLARAGVITYETALPVTSYLKQETHYIPWVAAFSGFGHFDSTLVTNTRFNLLKRYVVLSMEKLYSSLTFQEGAADKQTTILNRVNVLTWACKYDLADCVNNAKQEFDLWMINPTTKKVSPNKRSVVYCTALKIGGSNEWNFLWNQYMGSDLASDRALILSALGCTTNQILLQSYLLKSVESDSGIRKQDSLSVFSSVYNNPAGVDLALDFLVMHFPEMQETYVGFSAIGNAITGVAGKLTTRQQVDKLAAFLRDDEGLLDANAVAAGKRALETAEANLAWSDRYSKGILDWIQGEIGSGAATSSRNTNGLLIVLTSISMYILCCAL